MKPAPDFSLPDQTGTMRSLRDFAGRWLIIYFYPKDDTPGCTAEACNFRDAYGELAAQGVEVVGVSKDTARSHAKFAEKYGLRFPLLSDRSTEMIQAYGAWGRKKFMGREYDGIRRSTFLINPAGQIVREYPDVDPEAHAGVILGDVAELTKAAG